MQLPFSIPNDFVYIAIAALLWPTSRLRTTFPLQLFMPSDHDPGLFQPSRDSTQLRHDMYKQPYCIREYGMIFFAQHKPSQQTTPKYCINPVQATIQCWCAVSPVVFYQSQLNACGRGGGRLGHLARGRLGARQGTLKGPEGDH